MQWGWLPVSEGEGLGQVVGWIRGAGQPHGARHPQLVAEGRVHSVERRVRHALVSAPISNRTESNKHHIMNHNTNQNNTARKDLIKTSK